MKKYILALDEGTTSARAILFDRFGHTVAMAQHEFPQLYPHAGWVEQDPMAIYAAQYAAMTECLAGSGIAPAEIAALVGAVVRDIPAFTLSCRPDEGAVEVAYEFLSQV